MNFLQSTLNYLRLRQPPAVRFLHITILCLVLSQILVSNFMGFTDTGEVSNKVIKYYATWIHMLSGLTLIPLSLLFVYLEYRRYGIRYFFPYFYGEFSQLKKDLQTLLHFDLPEPEAYGLAAIIKGLGMGALLLVAFSGGVWFLSWNLLPSWAHSVKEIHETLTGLIEAYVIGHGGVGLVHLFFYWKNKSRH